MSDEISKRYFELRAEGYDRFGATVELRLPESIARGLERSYLAGKSNSNVRSYSNDARVEVSVPQFAHDSQHVARVRDGGGYPTPLTLTVDGVRRVVLLSQQGHIWHDKSMPLRPRRRVA